MEVQKKYAITGTYTIKGTKYGTFDNASNKGFLNIRIDSLELDTKFFFIINEFCCLVKGTAKLRLFFYS